MYTLDRNVVVMAYRSEHPDKRDPKEATLQQFDSDLVSRYDSELARQAPDWGIPMNPFTRSMLVFFATRSTAQTTRTRVRHACQYFDSVRPQQASIPLPTSSPDPPSESNS